ncbi:hypothetical protein TcWFU_006150 [Taenia crassiceps]|uniref:Uncharacterized protein n=1 Tax=Taenia crassiceps TaxID=6207 RepID=A0ABR4QHD7_9CEST
MSVIRLSSRLCIDLSEGEPLTAKGPVSSLLDDEMGLLLGKARPLVNICREVSDQAAAAGVLFQSAGLRSTDAFIVMLTTGQNLAVNNLETRFSAIDPLATVNDPSWVSSPGFELVYSRLQWYPWSR